MSMKIRIFKGRASILFGVAMFVAAPAFGGITFDCDSSIAADFRAGTCSYLNSTVAALYGSTFTNANASVYIEATNQGLGESTSGFFNIVSYSVYQSALQTESTDAAKAFVPASQPSIFGGGDVSITSALAQALGITDATHGGGGTPNGILGIEADGITSCTTPGTAGCYSGIIFVNDPTDLDSQTHGQGYTYESLGGSTNGTTENYDFFAVVEHELDEVLGTASCIGLTDSGPQNNCFGASSAVDQFRYSASGVRAWDSQSPTDQYFSANGGVTDLDGNLYNTTKSGEDWADFSQGCVFIQDAEACPSDNPATNSFSILTDGPGGTVGPEVAILNAVGYDLKTQTASTPEPASMGLLGFGLMALGGLAYRRRRQKSESL
jgi:PEP-CTERM motif